MHILMVAAENGALNGCKVGGIADVLRDAPIALAAAGCTVSVITPAYGFLHRKARDADAPILMVPFGGEKQAARWYGVHPDIEHAGVSHYVIDHPIFNAFDPASNTYRIYIDDPPDRPFAGDATKFAFFCLAVAEALKLDLLKAVTHIHLHDWHAAFLLLLRAYHPRYLFLKNLPAIYTIHNLGLQGIRPFSGDQSSLNAWYPGLHYDWLTLKDPRWDCINPMAVGIRLADRVHTVSPSYAHEILQPSDRPHIYGGEGLENDLRRAHRQERLFGILNGCDYPQNTAAPALPFDNLLRLLKHTIVSWSGLAETVTAAHFTAFARIGDWLEQPEPPGLICTSVGRLQDQKMLLLKEAGSGTRSGLERLLDALGSCGILILLGTGDPEYERFFTRISAQRHNFLFVKGYSDACADALYRTGNLFLMPSSYEPCGISQMLAMRAGQPCLAHAVGGLRDTVKDLHNGFCFGGGQIEDQIEQMVSAFENALALMVQNPHQWQKIRQNAAAEKFSWKQSTEWYIRHLYV
jgi:starch synthase